MHEAQHEKMAAGDLVVIGVDPHKASVTIEARDTRERLRATGTFPTRRPGIERCCPSPGSGRGGYGPSRVPAVSGRILADVGNGARFPSRHHFASWTGTAPIDASSGAHQRHRLSRAGKPAAEPRAAHRRDRPDATPRTLGKAYYDRKRAAGKRPPEASAHPRPGRAPSSG